ncbi:ribokinase [Bacillus sp. SD088]|uniref:ribokinase n=1 Tax=Bacillus sp. SD088 TaxID=2782012 RepID=UPI001A95E763|nr:ribokinase [Bacillus sp. SD088]MBO0991692.1 ribokinase [Bacillus sp. SD088]
MDILVIGSFMMDLVVRTPRVPENGETIIGKSFSRFPGGKGANQAVSAARLGGKVTMAGKLGVDLFGDEAIKTLKKEDIDTSYILRDDEHPTGVGSVTLEENGHNRIIVVPGANLAYGIEDLNKIRELIRRSKVLVVQLEMELEMIHRAISYAYEYEIPVILNPAPAQKLSDELLRKVTYLTPNETEIEILTDIKVTTKEDAEKAGKALLEKGVQTTIITLGERGAFVVSQDGSFHVSGFPMKAYDTVAAGDAFNGALAVGVAQGKPILEVVKQANAAGALTVTRAGAIPSLPTLKEIEAFSKEFQSRTS